ncbi:MAG: L-ribulose-5-phosphate 4-epimerase AraD [Lentisphaerae bacterium]|nr:L-ribulose-5-phosphate 4-epimerase AraD [Lentisphaerota bacterium]
MYEHLKQAVCEANRMLGRAGLAPLTWGNASGVDRAGGVAAIKPSGVGYADLEPAHMTVVDLDGARVEGALNPSSDTPTHLVLYRAFEGIGGIVHTHSPYATMFAQACREIPCLGTTHADVFRGPVPLTRGLRAGEIESDYERGTGRAIAERFANLDPAAVPGVLVAHHGPFTWGVSAAAAVENAVALEAIARMAWGTLRLAPDTAPVDPALLEKHYTRKHGARAYYGQRNEEPLSE